MSKGARGDIARQVAVMLGAIFQIAVPRSSRGQRWDGCPGRT